MPWAAHRRPADRAAHAHPSRMRAAESMSWRTGRRELPAAAPRRAWPSPRALPHAPPPSWPRRRQKRPARASRRAPRRAPRCSGRAWP
eukprot:5459556-Prymnesium_polylepis.1